LVNIYSSNAVNCSRKGNTKTECLMLSTGRRVAELEMYLLLARVCTLFTSYITESSQFLQRTKERREPTMASLRHCDGVSNAKLDP
jgi:hypothetical protein